MARDSLRVTALMLERARLTAAELDSPCPPGRIARAIRAELWFGTLEGAHAQSRLGACNLLTTNGGMNTPALLYLGLGRDAFQAEAARSAAAIAAAVADRLEQGGAEGLLPITAATRLLELGDMLGPVMAIGETAPLLAAFGDVLEACAVVVLRADAGCDELAAAGARRAAARLAQWRQAAFNSAAAAELLRSYDDLGPEHVDWDTRPRMELVMAHDLFAASLSPGLIDALSLPPALETRLWSDAVGAERAESPWPGHP